jgi:beta-1,4-mannooligosaccharide/beta-1,4-mannosyl-N-acetylglucosamine phosphorylase
MTFTRSLANPIIDRRDIAIEDVRLRDPSSVFNPGAVMHEGRFLLLLRVQSRGRETFLVTARGDDGVAFDIADRITPIAGIDSVPGTVFHVYDPRITRLEGLYYVTLALDTDRGCRTALATTSDFERLELIGIVTDDDARNAVLFPEKIGGRLRMLDRPNVAQPGGNPASGNEIRLLESTDLEHWRSTATTACGRPHYWDERLGPGPPPVKTRAGWLLVYHGVATHFGSTNIYQAGAMLLDLDDPSRVVARTRENLLEPRESYELAGQVPGVIFPTGIVVDRFDPAGFAEPTATVFLYYGAADTAVGLATTTVGKLVAACDTVDG